MSGSWLIVGLGNPSRPGTRHSVGRDVAEAAAAQLGATWRVDRRVGAALAPAPGACVCLPAAAMNDSGKVARAARSVGAVPERVIVIHDDLRMPLGTVRVMPGGGQSGGHNGVKSVHASLRSAATPLVQVGIGKPRGCSTAEYVLAPWAEGEEETRDAAVADAAAAVLRLVEQGAADEQVQDDEGAPPPRRTATRRRVASCRAVAKGGTGGGDADHEDLVLELTRLFILHRAGALDRLQFAAAKAVLLGV